MDNRPSYWWFYLGILACAVVLTVAAVRRMRYVYENDMIVDTWTHTACDQVTCARVDALLDTANARLPKAPAFAVDTSRRYSPDNPFAPRR